MHGVLGLGETLCSMHLWRRLILLESRLAKLVLRHVLSRLKAHFKILAAKTLIWLNVRLLNREVRSVEQSLGIVGHRPWLRLRVTKRLLQRVILSDRYAVHG